eukprot:4582106-Amphidinium_carterae.1
MGHLSQVVLLCQRPCAVAHWGSRFCRSHINADAESQDNRSVWLSWLITVRRTVMSAQRHHQAGDVHGAKEWFHRMESLGAGKLCIAVLLWWIVVSRTICDCDSTC